MSAYFTADLFRFLGELEKHNNREWFLANKERYEKSVRDPFLQLVKDLGPRLAKLSAHIVADPKPVGGSMMRIHRDIRFSKDKRPYKDHLDMSFRNGGSKGAPGYWFRLTPTRLVLGAGMHMLDKPDLERFRMAVDARGSGEALDREVTKLEKSGYDLGGEHYKRVPAGFPPDHPREALLRHNGVYAGTEMKLPAEARTARFPAFCAGHYKKLAPLMDWLSTNVA